MLKKTKPLKNQKTQKRTTLPLDEEYVQMLSAIKKKHNIKNDTVCIRELIKHYYDEHIKV